MLHNSRPCIDVRTRVPDFRQKVFLVIFFSYVLTLPFLGITILPLIGEEPRRGQVAREMFWSRDWLVPREQGELYCTRPPLQNWLIGCIALVRGKFDVWCIRIPSAVATAVTALMCYLFARKHVGPTASIAAPVTYLTMGQSLTIGQLGETDSVFAALLGTGLLLWYSGWTSKTRKANLVVLAGFLAGLAGLTKGLQAPVYFVACTAGFLIISRQAAKIFSTLFLAGIAGLFFPIALWTLPYALTAGLQATREIWFGQVEERLVTQGLLKHIVAFPVETFVAMLPWSWLCFSWADRSFREWTGCHRSLVRYLFFCLGIGFLSLWVVPEAKNRYFLPLYPLAAVLWSLPWQYISELFAFEKTRHNRVLPALRIFLTLAQWVPIPAIILAISFFLAGIWPTLGRMMADLHLSVISTLAVIATGLVAIVIIRHATRAPSGQNLGFAMLAFGLFLGIGHRFGVLPVQKQLLWSPRVQIERLAMELGKEQQLVSLGPVPAAFRFHYPSFIEKLPHDIRGLPPGVSVFCLAGTQYAKGVDSRARTEQEPYQFQWNKRTITCPKVSFPWRVRQVVPLGRTPTRDPQPVVIVGQIVSQKEPDQSQRPS